MRCIVNSCEEYVEGHTIGDTQRMLACRKHAIMFLENRELRAAIDLTTQLKRELQTLMFWINGKISEKKADSLADEIKEKIAELKEAENAETDLTLEWTKNPK